ncbi:hypothetical protein [Paracoccus salsus]|uniref:hypothetical protein n=1 Tax=Paracoccus salsus TaxID=2911061 RepID=UPI001F476F39|nr:hypothetical protein [Paracoccus salsus]MCF3974451.1 hypothetical protein [Paracoccus salsus]
MPRLVRLYVKSVLIGLALALSFTILLLVLDVGGLGRLVLASPVGWLAALMLVIFNAIVFSGVQFAFAIMRLADSPPAGGGRQPLVMMPLRAALSATARSRAGK